MDHEATIRGVGVSVGEEGVGPPAVILEARDEIIPIFVDQGQAQTISRAEQGVPAQRPMTHDLFVNVLEDAGVTVDQVRIDDLVGGTFHAKLDLVIDQGDTVEKAVRDARPSDGLALAVRVGCPVLVADEVIDEAGHPPDCINIDTPGHGGLSPRSGGIGPSVGSGDPDLGESEEGESVDLDDAVDIDIDDAEDTEQDDDPES